MPQKPISVRIEEMKKIYTEIDRLGLGSQFEEIKAFQQICNEYVRTGVSQSGSISLPFINRKLVYMFPSANGKECVAVLKAR